MKSLFFVSLLCLISCSKNSSSESVNEGKRKPNPYKSISVDKQSLVIQDLRADVTMIVAEQYAGERALFYQVKTPTQTLRFAFYKWTEEPIEPFPPGGEKLFADAGEAFPEPIDLKIADFVQNFAIHNVLSLDRCRQVQAREEAIALLQAKRDTIYFAIKGLSLYGQTALRWNSHSKAFEGLAKTSVWSPFLTGGWQDQELFLTPNSNPRDSQGNLLSDSLFLSAGVLNRRCDSWYSKGQARPAIDQKDRSEDYLPYYNEEMDLWRSQAVSVVSTIDAVLGASEPIYRVPNRSELRADLIEYAKNHPLYLVISKETP